MNQLYIIIDAESINETDEGPLILYSSFNKYRASYEFKQRLDNMRVKGTHKKLKLMEFHDGVTIDEN